MRIEALILAALAPLLVGCERTGSNCDPGPRRFVLDSDLNAAELAGLRAPDDRRGEPTCEELCRHALMRNKHLFLTSAESCTHTPAPPSSDANAPAAHVRCEGVGLTNTCEGRRPLGHVEADADADDPLARHLARAAHLEAASVDAFAELADQLAASGAPDALLARCRRAAADEARHASALGALAAARGAAPPTPSRCARPASLADIAAHNAVEGCVHEAWAAVRAAWLAARCPDPEIRAAYAPIAAEEAGHAQLAWDLHAWLIGQVDADARAAVAAAMRAAIDRLPRIAAAHDDPIALGMPPADQLIAAATRFAAGLAAAA